MERRVLLIGLDGATWDVIAPWAKGKKLPTFNKLMENGVWGILESTIPPITMPAWASMLTGKNPGKIGVTHFLKREKNGYNFKPVKLNMSRLNPLWKFLNRQGKKTNLFYIPTIIPNLSELKGMYIPGELVIGNIVPYPLKAKKLIEKFELDEKAPEFGKVNKVSYIEWWRNNTEKHLKLIAHLLDRTERWDFLMHVIYSLDHLSHLFWKYIDKKHPEYRENKEIFKAILNYYQSLDRLLGNIVQKCKSKNITLFLVSDHGHGPNMKKVCLNKWLEQHGYLCIKGRGSCFRKKLLSLLKSKILAIPIVKPQFVYSRLNRFSTIWNLFKSFFINLEVNTDIIDWEKTRAYFSGYNGISINLKGREPKGIVDPKEYEKIRTQIITKLKTLKDPERGKEVVQNVWKREEVYEGNFVYKLSDIVIEYANVSEYESAFIFSDSAIKKEIFYRANDPPTSSAHTYKGILLVYGPGIRKGVKIEGAKIYDITPTILHVFGLPITKDVDGKVLKEIFKENSEEFRRETQYIENERNRVRMKIKELKSSHMI